MKQFPGLLCLVLSVLVATPALAGTSRKHKKSKSHRPHIAKTTSAHPVQYAMNTPDEAPVILDVVVYRTRTIR